MREEKVISENVDSEANRYWLTRIHATPTGHVVRVVVNRPHDRLGPAATPTAEAALYRHEDNAWLSLTELGRHDWDAGATDVDVDAGAGAVFAAAVVEQLGPAATQLYQQAREILSYAPPTIALCSHSAGSSPGILALSSSKTAVAVQAITADGGIPVAVYPDYDAANEAIEAVNGVPIDGARMDTGGTLLVQPSVDALRAFVSRMIS